MPLNSSSIITTPPPPLCDSNTTVIPVIFSCFVKHPPATWIFSAFTIANVLHLPLYVLVLSLGFRRWRNQASKASGTINHSDVFTYHIVILEILTVLSLFGYFCGIYMCSVTMMMFGYFCFCGSIPTQTLFHCFACMERYVAVVYPITYRGLRHSDRVRVRNISIGCNWLFSIPVVGLTAWYYPMFPKTTFVTLNSLIMIAVSFFNLSIICTLIRLGLGKVDGGRKETDKSKRRAFYIILVITGLLVLRSCGLMACNILFDSDLEYEGNECVWIMSVCWLLVPSSLAPPLFYLHRAGALAWFSR